MKIAIKIEKFYIKM